jgi:Uma2 family endonuclease
LRSIPEIAAEVLSPSETPRMIHRKLKQYFEAGVKEVWLVDPDSLEVEVWTGTTLPERALKAGETLGSRLLPGFKLPLKKLFA